MKYKKISFSFLGKIEKHKAEKERINLKNLCLQKKKNDEQLKLLRRYQKEYVEKMYNKMKLGMYVHQWENHNNFISILQKIINNNIDVIKVNQKMIDSSIQKWSNSYIKMKIWNHLNIKNKKQILKIKKINEQSFSDYYSQFMVITKGSLYVRNYT